MSERGLGSHEAKPLFVGTLPELARNQKDQRAREWRDAKTR